MKRTTFLQLIAILIVGTTKADVLKSEKPLWNSNGLFYDEVGLTDGQLSSASGKYVRVYITPCSGGGSLNIVTKETENWTVKATILGWGWQSSGTPYYEFFVSDNSSVLSYPTFLSPISTNVLSSDGSFNAEEGSTYDKENNKLSTSTSNTGFTYDLSGGTTYGCALMLKTSAEAQMYIKVVYSDDSYSEVSDESAIQQRTLVLTPTKTIKTIIVRNQSTGDVVLSEFALYHLSIDSITLMEYETLDKSSESSKAEIWSGSHDLDSWNQLDLTGTSYKTDKLDKAKLGDILRVTYTSDEAGKIDFLNSSSETLKSFSVTTIGEATTVEYEISTVAIMEGMKNNGLRISGTNALLNKVELVSYSTSYNAASVTIGTDGIATYSNSIHLNFNGTGIVPYWASAVSEGSVTLTSTASDANPCTTNSYAGYILQGDPGTYTIPETKSSSYHEGDGANKLKYNITSNTITASTSGTYHYILAKHNSDIGFYKLTSDHTLAAHKAYLETKTDITPSLARAITLNFDDGTTAILPIFQDGNSSIAGSENNACYTLQGIRVQNPTKGLYIQNGKKFMVK